ncbi:unnamed protein product [Hydatigera taeniaeformis]|uniref:FERM_C domain-containing protein n=1 Tax=Hydatigena taeniaeformis TaxID=6205 RepID=A0A0R3WWU3_HYDTA|nr:unnamed protein product [Hydatigera taeniaeformis]
MKLEVDEQWFDRMMQWLSTYKSHRTRGYMSLIHGVDALGLGIYETDDRFDPNTGFTWPEIQSPTFHDKKFIIQPADETAKEFYFLVEDPRSVSAFWRCAPAIMSYTYVEGILTQSKGNR